MTPPKWTETPKGYAMETPRGRATLEKEGKAWILKLGAQSRELGRRATFDHAEGALLEFGAFATLQ